MRRPGKKIQNVTNVLPVGAVGKVRSFRTSSSGLLAVLLVLLLLEPLIILPVTLLEDFMGILGDPLASKGGGGRNLISSRFSL